MERVVGWFRGSRPVQLHRPLTDPLTRLMEELPLTLATSLRFGDGGGGRVACANGGGRGGAGVADDDGGGAGAAEHRLRRSEEGPGGRWWWTLWSVNRDGRSPLLRGSSGRGDGPVGVGRRR